MSTSPGGSVYKSPGFALRGARSSMPHVVRRYDSVEEYLDGITVGTPVSASMKTWEKAERVRNLLRGGEIRYYYNITHTTSITVIDREIDNDER